MAGFISGEGCFFISLNKGRNKKGVGFNLVFQISQHIRDELLLKSFIAFFNPCPRAGDGPRGCGYYVLKNELSKHTVLGWRTPSQAVV